MMKKNIAAIMALLCLTLGLTACGGNDEPKSTVTASATYQIDFSDDLVDVANIAIVYIADNGQVSIESLPTGNKQWLKRVSYPITGKSVNLGFKVVYTLTTSDFTRDNYDLTAQAKVTASTPTSSRTFEETLLNGASTRKNKVTETVTRNTNKAFGVTVTKEGSIERNPNFTVSI